MPQQPRDKTTGRGLLTTVLAACVCATTLAHADWPTCRGSAQRTGNLDDQAGPRTPAVRWAYKAQEDYIASPLLEGSAIYFPALGPFNTGMFHCLTAQNNQPRLHWSKQAPVIKRPLVCSPVSSEGLLYFGDGMHQTDDAILYCVMADTGRPVWQYPVPGKLVHLEASPTVDRGRVYTGGGDAGVICLNAKRVLLDGKEMDLASSQDLIEQRWKQLTTENVKAGAQALTYSAEPNEDALPKPAPKLVWQKGKGVWHVDTPVTVAGDSVLVGSAYLDEEKIGKRSLLCLRASDGEPAWELPLEINPWAGATVSGHIVLVGCSSIRFDTETINTATGEVVAVYIDTGRVAWRKKVPGGVLSAIAVKDGLAIFTATDGKLRAWQIDTGKEAWQFDARHPFFAGPAVAGGVVYAADLTGLLHAVQLANGRPLWTFDVVNTTGTQLPGMVYGSPVVHRGQIYLTTCNVQGPNAGKPGMVVCVGDKQELEAGAAGATLQIDKPKRTVRIPCRIAPRKLPTLADVYPLEVIACFPAPIGQKSHETAVSTEVKPSDLHQALLQLGLQPGAPVHGDTTEQPTGSEVSLALEITDVTGQLRVIPIEETLIDERTGRSMPPLKWFFTGSVLREPAAAGLPRAYAADLSGTLITLFPVTSETVLQSSLSMKPRATLRLDTDKALLPPEGTAARLIISAEPAWVPVSLRSQLDASSPFAVPPVRYRTPQPTTLSALFPVALQGRLQEPVLREGTRLTADELAKIRQAMAPEPAQLFMSSATPMPPKRRLPAGALARAAIPESSQIPSLPPVPRTDPERQGLSIAATLRAADPAVPGTLPSLRQVPVTFMRLTIPEPVSSADAIRLNPPLPDDAAPVRLPVLPGKIELPVKKK